MIINRNLSKEQNLIRLIRESNSNMPGGANPDNFLFGSPLAVSGTRNTGITIQGIKNKGFSGVRDLTYNRCALTEGLVNPVLTVLRQQNETDAALFERISASLNILSTDVSYSLVSVSVMRLTVLSGSPIYLPGQSIDITIGAVADFIINANATGMNLYNTLTDRGYTGGDVTVLIENCSLYAPNTATPGLVTGNFPSGIKLHIKIKNAIVYGAGGGGGAGGTGSNGGSAGGAGGRAMLVSSNVHSTVIELEAGGQLRGGGGGGGGGGGRRQEGATGNPVVVYSGTGGTGGSGSSNGGSATSGAGGGRAGSTGSYAGSGGDGGGPGASGGKGSNSSASGGAGGAGGPALVNSSYATLINFVQGSNVFGPVV